METVMYILIWVGAIFLMMRFGCGAHVMGHGSHKQDSLKKKSHSGNNSPPRWIAPKSDTDPVCGMSVQTDSAKSAVYDGNVYYFCSQNCRENFEAAPDTYLFVPANEPMKKEI